MMMYHVALHRDSAVFYVSTNTV